MWVSTAFCPGTQNISLGFVFTQSLDFLVWVPPKANPETRIQIEIFIWEVTPGSTGKLVGKVEQERVPPKGSLNDQVPVHV